MAGLRRLIRLQTHHGGAGGLQRARGGVRVAGADAARVRDDVASVASALICRHGWIFSFVVCVRSLRDLNWWLLWVL